MTKTTPNRDIDERMMAHAVALSRQHMITGAGGPFGAVVVMDGEVVAEGWNQVTSTNDPTAHAEVVAIRRACARLNRFDLRGATLYTSCEPCSMCLSSALWARVNRIVYSNTRRDAAEIGFDDEPFYQEMVRAPRCEMVETEHWPSAEALAVFRAWAEKPDKVRY